jgi:hypothetical protein
MPCSRRSRSALYAALKLLVTVGLLSWLLSATDLAAIGAALRSARPGWVLAAFGLHFVGLLISAVRWRLLLRAQGAEVSLPFLSRSLLVGIFFNNFLPSTVGGDLMRARDTADHAGSGTGSLTTVLVERASGILVLGFFALAALLAGTLEGRGAAAAAAGVAALLGGFLVFTGLLRPRPLARARLVLERRLETAGGAVSSRLLSGAERLLRTLGAISAAPGTMRIVFLLAFLLQANVILHHWFVSRSLGLAVAPGAFLIIVPLATLLLLLPVSINGIGAREAVFAYLLGIYGVPLAQAVAFSWVLYGTILAQGILGGLVYALRRRP